MLICALVMSNDGTCPDVLEDMEWVTSKPFNGRT